MDNQEAKISQGKQIPYATFSDQGTQTSFKDADLELVVNPQVTPDGTIVLDVKLSKDEADFSRSINGVPPIDSTEAETRVLIDNGDTLVIGGIFKTNKTTTNAGVPKLSSMPILKWIFSKELENIESTELMIFITPTIINR
jgi:type IV pilus assembly protein PilQ